MGEKEEPLFDCVENGWYSIMVLHLTIGIVNDVLDSYTSEMQAAVEPYTDEYCRLEKEKETNKESLLLDTKGLVTYMATHKDYIKSSKQEMRSHDCTVEERHFIIVHLEEVQKEKLALQEEVDSWKLAKERTDSDYAKEIEKDEHSKQFGQPVGASVHDTLKKYGMDRAAQHGGKLEGNQC